MGTFGSFEFPPFQRRREPVSDVFRISSLDVVATNVIDGSRKKTLGMPELQRNQQPGRAGEADLLLQPGYRVVEPTVQEVVLQAGAEIFVRSPTSHLQSQFQKVVL